MHSQSLILKLTKGALSNPIIHRFLWEQSCILQTLTKLPAYCKFDPKSIFNAWRMWAYIILLEVAGSVSGKVGSYKQVDLPIHRLQHWMQECQLPQTHLSLISHTWPLFDLSRSCTHWASCTVIKKTGLGMMVLCTQDFSRFSLLSTTDSQFSFWIGLF